MLARVQDVISAAAVLERHQSVPQVSELAAASRSGQPRTIRDRLAPEEFERLLAAARSGACKKALAAEFGISRRSIHRLVEANRESMITITDIRAENIECEAPAGGTHFIFATQGEGEPSSLGITIDAPSPAFKVLPEDWYLLPDPDPDAALASFAVYGQSTVITLGPGEQHVIRFFAHAAEQTCRWDVELEYTADGTRQTTPLASEGEHAFALAALLPIESYGTVIIPWTYCSDYEGRVLPGPEAAAIVTEMSAGSGSVDCP